jgi:hypothetical protein
MNILAGVRSKEGSMELGGLEEAPEPASVNKTATIEQDLWICGRKS